MDTPAPTRQNQSNAAQEIADWRRDVVNLTSWVLGLAFLGAGLWHPLCYCPMGWYITSAISLIPLTIGVGRHRWFGCVALAFSILLAIGEVNGEREERRQAARLETEDLIWMFDQAFRAYKENYGDFPSGTPAELLATMRGKNPRNIVFVEFATRDLNAAGELIDGWKTPFRFVQTSHSDPPRLISAGPDRKFGTEDDVTLDNLQTKRRQ